MSFISVKIRFLYFQINYESVATVNRCNENLISPVAISAASRRVKTSIFKHKHKTKYKVIELEKVMLNLDNEEIVKVEHPIENKSVSTVFDNTILVNNDNNDTKLPIAQIEIKTETSPPFQPVKAEELKDNVIDNTLFNTLSNTNVEPNIDTNTDIDIHNTNIDTNDEMDNTDHIDNAISSDDENIFLDIVKKAVKGESKLVFLDNIKVGPIKKKRKFKKKSEGSKSKVHKFEKPKKELLSSEHWRKFNLSEDEAMHEFKQREHSDQYVNANYKCHMCLKGFSKVEMLMRHVKFRHEEVRICLPN